MTYFCNAESSNSYSFQTVEDSIVITIESMIGTIRIENSFEDLDEAKTFFCDTGSRHDFGNEAYDFGGNPFHVLSLLLHHQQQGCATVKLNGHDLIPDRMEDTAGWPDVVNENTPIRQARTVVPLKTFIKKSIHLEIK